MIKSLQSLRFVFALMIFFHHFPVNGEGLFEAGGTCGVSFFLILSGFVMSAGYGDKVSRQDFNYHNFLIKRIIRLYPLHIICLFVAAALALIAGSFSVKDIALLGINALLLQSWIPIRGVYFSFNAVSWCLADLVFFYALFPCLRKAFSKVGLKVSLAFIAVLIVIYLGIATVIPDNLTHPLLYISPLFRLLDFIIGIILYDLYKYISESWRQKKINVSILELVSIIFVSGAILLYPYIPDRYVFASYWWFPISCLVVVFALSDKLGGGRIAQLLEKDWLLACGGISFSFYMIHQLGIRIINIVVHMIGVEISWTMLLPVSFLIILLCGFLVNRYYENPISSKLKRIMIK